MSSLTFHDENGALGTVHGSERGHGLEVAIDACLHALGATTDPAVNRLIHQGVLPPDATAFTVMGETPLNALRGWMRDVIGFNSITIRGETVPVTHAVLNTAAVEGPDVVAFLARVHGSVEDRIWIDHKDLPWFAALLEEGRAQGHLRPDAGWEGIVARVADASSPVVITSSQGQDFPDPDSGWQESLDRLRQGGWWLQLAPKRLRESAYAPLATFHDLLGVRQ